MQALTPTLFPCYAAADRKLARRIAEFLERGADIRVFFEEGELQPGEDLADKAREGRIADIVLVLFSRDSLPPRWPRAQWEGALVKEPAEENVRIAFVNCDGCSSPKVLSPMFEANLNGLRQIKRWIRTGNVIRGTPAVEPELEVLGIAIADRPGVETIESTSVARAFADVFQEDFDAVSILECGERSLTALVGDFGTQLGLRLDGPPDSNLARLHDFCTPRRILLVLDGMQTPEADALVLEGRCSTLISTEVVSHHSSDPVRVAQMALAHPTEEWSEICHQARQGRRLLREQSRLAECYELMEQWRRAAEVRGDRVVLEESVREIVWILEGWGFTDESERLEEERVTCYAEQMTLPFG